MRWVGGDVRIFFLRWGLVVVGGDGCMQIRGWVAISLSGWESWIFSSSYGLAGWCFVCGCVCAVLSALDECKRLVGREGEG